MQGRVLLRIYLIGIAICLGDVSECLYAKSFSNSSSAVSQFEIPSLAIFIRQTLDTNPAIQAADANVAAARARERAASQPLYNPELALQGQDATDSIYTVGINQSIDWANKRGARKRVGSAEVEVAQAQRAVLHQQLTAEILNALTRYQTAQGIVSLAKERTLLLQKFVALTEKRHANGDVARVDVDLAQLALGEALAQQAGAEVNLNQALEVLRATTGVIRAQWPLLPRSLPSPAQTYLETDMLVQHLPTMQVLNNQYLSAQARIRLAERQRRPDPTIGIQGGREYTNEGNSDVIGVNLNLPLFIRNPYRAEVDAANEDAIEAEKKRMNILRQTRASIISSAERYQTLYQSLQQWQKLSSKPLSDGMVLIERLWQAGEITTTEYLVQLKQRIDSQIAGAELQGRTWQSWVEWLSASGTIETWTQTGKAILLGDRDE